MVSMSSSPLAPSDHIHDRDFDIRDLDDERNLHNQRFPRASDPLARSRPPIAKRSIGKRMLRTVTRFVVTVLIGVGLTVGWQTYGEQAKELTRIWAPSVAWMLPQADPKPPTDADVMPEMAQQIKLIALDVAIVRRNVSQLATSQDQLAAKQDRMTQNIASLQEIEQDVRQKALSLPVPKPVVPLAPKPALHPTARNSPQPAPPQ
jgi:hypothetical protein